MKVWGLGVWVVGHYLGTANIGGDDNADFLSESKDKQGKLQRQQDGGCENKEHKKQAVKLKATFEKQRQQGPKGSITMKRNKTLKGAEDRQL